jgi:prevent-host-death family protein
MNWNIAQAKQQFSEVVRLAAQEPQAICNRDTPVAVLISAHEFGAFRQWKAQQAAPSFAHIVSGMREQLVQAGHDGIDLPSRSETGRANAQLDEPQADPSPASPAKAAAIKKKK